MVVAQCHSTSQQCSDRLLTATDPQFEGVAGEEHAITNIERDAESGGGEGRSGREVTETTGVPTVGQE